MLQSYVNSSCNYSDSSFLWYTKTFPYAQRKVFKFKEKNILLHGCISEQFQKEISWGCFSYTYNRKLEYIVYWKWFCIGLKLHLLDFHVIKLSRQWRKRCIWTYMNSILQIITYLWNWKVSQAIFCCRVVRKDAEHHFWVLFVSHIIYKKKSVLLRRSNLCIQPKCSIPCQCMLLFFVKKKKKEICNKHQNWLLRTSRYLIEAYI